MAEKVLKDSDGVIIKAGDVLHFSYGIPPVGVTAPVVCRNGQLIAITAGHNPSQCPVKDLENHVGEFWVERPLNSSREADT